MTNQHSAIIHAKNILFLVLTKYFNYSLKGISSSSDSIKVVGVGTIAALNSNYSIFLFTSGSGCNYAKYLYTLIASSDLPIAK